MGRVPRARFRWIRVAARAEKGRSAAVASSHGDVVAARLLIDDTTRTWVVSHVVVFVDAVLSEAHFWRRVASSITMDDANGP